MFIGHVEGISYPTPGIMSNTRAVEVINHARSPGLKDSQYTIALDRQVPYVVRDIDVGGIRVTASWRRSIVHHCWSERHDERCEA